MKVVLALLAVLLLCAKAAPALAADRLEQLEAAFKVQRPVLPTRGAEHGLELITTIINRGPKPVEFLGWINSDLRVVSPGSWKVTRPSNSVIITGSGLFSTTKLAAGESHAGSYFLSQYFTEVTPGRNKLELLIDIHGVGDRAELRQIKTEISVFLSRRSAAALNRYFRERRQLLGS